MNLRLLKCSQIKAALSAIKVYPFSRLERKLIQLHYLLQYLSIHCTLVNFFYSHPNVVAFSMVWILYYSLLIQKLQTT